jgi:hypothetical protein
MDGSDGWMDGWTECRGGGSRGSVTHCDAVQDYYKTTISYGASLG